MLRGKDITNCHEAREARGEGYGLALMKTSFEVP